jgi:hypothetical protein
MEGLAKRCEPSCFQIQGNPNIEFDMLRMSFLNCLGLSSKEVPSLASLLWLVLLFNRKADYATLILWGKFRFVLLVFILIFAKKFVIIIRVIFYLFLIY